MKTPQEWAEHYHNQSDDYCIEDLAAEIQKDAINWSEDDPRMWQEQCRIGDIAFQHLFCVSKGKKVPDWCEEGLQNVYHLIGEIKALKEVSETWKRNFEEVQTILAKERYESRLLKEKFDKALRTWMEQTVPTDAKTLSDELYHANKQIETREKIIERQAKEIQLLKLEKDSLNQIIENRNDEIYAMQCPAPR